MSPNTGNSRPVRKTRNQIPNYSQDLTFVDISFSEANETGESKSKRKRRNTSSSMKEGEESPHDLASNASIDDSNQRRSSRRNVKKPNYSEQEVASPEQFENSDEDFVEDVSIKKSNNSSRRSSDAIVVPKGRGRRNIIQDSDDEAVHDTLPANTVNDTNDIDDNIASQVSITNSVNNASQLEKKKMQQKKDIVSELIPKYYKGPYLNTYFYNSMVACRRKPIKSTLPPGFCDNPFNKHPEYTSKCGLKAHNIKKLPLFFEKVVTQSKSKRKNPFSDQAPPIAPENWAQILEHRSYVAYKVKLPSRAPSDFKPVHPSQIGGLRGHLDLMFNHLVFPFLDETKDDPIVPSNGFLFHGPPGTGKTLLARAVVEMCFPYNPTAFFYIKASDLLSKWVGQTEQMLRDLFRQAQIWSPSLILLDEIDGLAQDRSDNTSAKNKGILSSLLTLMDGLHSSSRVTVIGTTNHLSNLDPALRRPGRFDHELEFQLPDLEARLAIITLSTTNMAHPPEAEMLREVATRLSGYSGADITKLCNVAKQCAIDRTFPDIVKGKNLDIASNNIEVFLLKEDWDEAILKCNPSSYRSLPNQPAPLPRSLLPLLGKCYDNAMDFFHYRLNMIQKTPDIRRSPPTLWLQGDPGPAMSALESAILQGMGVNQVVSLDLPSLQSSTFSLDFALARKLEIIPTNSTTYTTSVIYIPCGPTWVEEVGPFMNLITNALSQPTHRSHIFIMVTGSVSDCQILIDYLNSTDIQAVTYDKPTLQQRIEFLGTSFKHLSHPEKAKPASHILPEIATKSDEPSKVENIYPDPSFVRSFRFFRQEAIDLIDSMMKRKHISALLNAPKDAHFTEEYFGPKKIGLRDIKEALTKNEIVSPSTLSEKFTILYQQTSFCYRKSDPYMVSLALGLRYEIQTFAKILNLKLVNQCEQLKTWIEENKQSIEENKIDVFSIRLASNDHELADQISHPVLIAEANGSSSIPNFDNDPNLSILSEPDIQPDLSLFPESLKSLPATYLSTIYQIAELITEYDVDQIVKLLDNPVLKSAENSHELLRLTFQVLN